MIQEISDMYHCLTPSLSYIRSFIKRLQLGFSAKFPVSFGYRVEKSREEIREERETGGNVTETHTQIYPAGATITRIMLRPELALGAAFQAVPGVLNLQAGFSLAMGYRGAWKKAGPTKYTAVTVITNSVNATGETVIDEKTLTAHEVDPL
jgi:hypothetical protein